MLCFIGGDEHDAGGGFSRTVRRANAYVHVLEMRNQESGEGGEKRRQLAASRRSLVEALVHMRSRQEGMQRSLQLTKP